MTQDEFDAKWKDIRCGHDDSCERAFGFDFSPCTCGLVELWDARNRDLATVDAIAKEDDRGPK